MHLFVLAGEPSGDLHGQKVLEALWKKQPDLEIHGVGGSKMRAAGLKTLLPMEEFQMLGFTSIFGAFPKLIKQFHLIRDFILETRPEGVLLIDYPGFNLRLAKALRKKGYRGKIIQYICPQVWMWFKKDIGRLVESFDLLLCIFPFELPIFEKTALPTYYVGHPSLEAIQQHTYGEPFPDEPILGLFPGSRPGVIRRNLPWQLHVAKQLQKENPSLRICISNAHPETTKLAGEDAQLVPETHSYDLMRACTFAIATSGTVTLELALHQTPTVVASAYSTFDSFIAENIFGVVPPFCIVNILGGKRVFPELFYREHTLENLYKEAKAMHDSEKIREQCRENCREIKEKLLSFDSPSGHVASSVLTLLK